MNIRTWTVIGALVAAGLTPWVAKVAVAQPAPADGAGVFDARCKGCHEPAVGRAPSRTDLANRPQADIVKALTSGIMVPMAQGLSPADIQAVASYLTASQSSADGTERRIMAVPTAPVGVDPMCKTNAPISASASDWPTMGVDDASTRFQRNPGLTAADVPKLKLKWSFAMAGGGQPTVVGGWLFTTNRSGKFYALDAKTGCVHWVVDDVVSRTTPMVVRSAISPSGWATFVGVSGRTVRAIDAQTGKDIWKSDVLEAHPVSVLTGSPIVSGDKIFVPISSIEEAAAMDKKYACCTFRGSLAALDLKTGKTLWKTSMISEPRQPLHKNGSGLDVQGPAGAAIWAAPSVDRKRGLVYVVTGDSYTDVETKGADAVVALEMNTGKIRWSHQVTLADNFVMGCGPTSTSGNCPTPLGPDYDFGATPVLLDLHGGGQVLMAGQKSGIAYGFNPDTGAMIWKTQVGTGSALGGIEWGIAADDQHLYVPVSDVGVLFGELRRPAGQAPKPGAPAAKPGLYALDPATGKVAWSAPAPVAPCIYASDKGKPSTCIRAQSAAPGVMPGVVFSGTLDGWFRAYDAKSGKIVWEYSTTAQTYETVNGVKGQPGGGIDGMGPTIAGGMVYTMSGFNGAARVGSNGVNVLLAFSKDGR